MARDRGGRDEDRRSSRGSHMAKSRSVDGREGSGRNNYGQVNKGSKSPFSGPSPMETRAQGERFGNRPNGPSLRGGSQNQSGGGEPSETVDRESMKDVRKHTGRN
jgi:hypothetical protein